MAKTEIVLGEIGGGSGGDSGVKKVTITSTGTTVIDCDFQPYGVIWYATDLRKALAYYGSVGMSGTVDSHFSDINGRYTGTSSWNTSSSLPTVTIGTKSVSCDFGTSASYMTDGIDVVIFGA